jgi:hypothetical protein
VRLQIKKEIFAIFKKYKMFTFNRITLRNGKKILSGIFIEIDCLTFVLVF